MKSIVKSSLFLFAFTMLLSSTAVAQIKLPQKSPAASVSYTVGMTTITINYSSPAVNDRTIWGELVPYGELWRAGANAATTIEFSTDINLEGEKLEAGKYSLFIIPREGEDAEWTVVLSNNTELWGAYDYDESQDAARFDVTPKFSKVSEERLNYSVHDQDIDKGYIRLGWENLRLYMRFAVKVLEPAMANVESALAEAKEEDKWAIYAQAANFLMENDWEMKKAMEWADKSTSMFDHSWNWFIKAQIQAKNGDYSGAIASAEKSKEVGMANENDNFYANSKSMIEGKVAEWKKAGS